MASKSQIAASMGLDMGLGGPVHSDRGGFGKEIQRRAAYGKVNVETLTAFLQAYIETGHKGRAAFLAGLSVSAIRTAERSDPEFAEEVEQARGLYLAKLRDHVWKVAVTGWKVPRFDAKGNLCGEEWKFSERMLEILCRMDPELRDKQDVDVKHSGGVLVVQAPVTTMDGWKQQVSQQRELLEAEGPTTVSKPVDDSKPVDTP